MFCLMGINLILNHTAWYRRIQMKVNVYRAKNSPDNRAINYILVKEGFNLDLLPSELKDRTGDLIPEKTIDLKPGEKRIALNTDEAIKSLEENQYYEQIAKIESRISASR